MYMFKFAQFYFIIRLSNRPQHTSRSLYNFCDLNSSKNAFFHVIYHIHWIFSDQIQHLHCSEGNMYFISIKTLWVEPHKLLKML